MQKYQGQRQFLCKMAEHAYEGNQDSFAYGEDQQIFQFVDEFPVVKAASLLKGAEQFQCISLDSSISHSRLAITAVITGTSTTFSSGN